MAVKTQYRDIVRRATTAAGAIGIPGAFSFGADVAVMSGIWGTMLVAIAQKSGHKIDTAYATKLTAGVLAGVGAYVGGSKIAMKLLHLIPGAGSLAAMGVNSFLNALFTYKFGHALSNLFDKGTFETADVATAVASLLGLVACLPMPNEIVDMVALISHS